MIRLNQKQILMMHSQLIKETGGTDGIRDKNLLSSALETPFQTFAGEELFPSIQAKAARLCLSILPVYTQAHIHLMQEIQALHVLQSFYFHLTLHDFVASRW